MGKHNEFGKQGEQLAVEFMVDKGYEIKYLNYRYLQAEIDIIARKGGILAIIEVKSRSSDFYENIAETVSKKKIRLMVMAADHYVLDNDLDVEVRFDIITVYKNKGTLKIEHLPDAFFYF